jgi:hypothetical protein
VHNAALSGRPKGIRLQCLVLPATERGENQEFAAQLPHSPRSEAEGGTSYYIVSVYHTYYQACHIKSIFILDIFLNIMSNHLDIMQFCNDIKKTG